MTDIEQEIATAVAERPGITLDEMLIDRRATHGDFGDHAAMTQTLKGVMYGDQAHKTNWIELTPVQREALEMIAHKIGCILAGDPTHKDHWDDIAGYARLVGDRL